MSNHKSTQLLHLDRQRNIEHGSLHQPIHTSIAYGFNEAQGLAEVFQNKRKGYAYGRASNPTVNALEDKISLLEDGIASCCFATGMAAISGTLLSLLQRGDHLISSAFLFGNTNSFFNTLTQLGIEVSFVDATDVANIKAAQQKNTKAVFVETIANPRTQISDLVKIGDYCEQNNLLYIVDNTLTTPSLFQPKSVKASLVINSLSKYIAGHGNALGGSVTDCGCFDWSKFSNIYDIYKKKEPSLSGILQIRKKGLRDMGGSLSAEVAHKIAIGAETLDLRINQSVQNALQLAEFLTQQEEINKVYYPGLSNHPQHRLATQIFKGYGSLISFELDESIDCFDFLNKLNFVIVAANLGDNRTLAIPAAQTIFYEMGAERRQSMGIAEGLIRLSVGIESFDDLQADFENALA
ncbi:MAG: cystathionine gamma-synthase family protein [Thiotrichaceae bacterium]|nr:cystathionine gamma-synthase family protein [Thiotrichaceae bacterium]